LKALSGGLGIPQLGLVVLEIRPVRRRRRTVLFVVVKVRRKVDPGDQRWSDDTPAARIIVECQAAVVAVDRVIVIIRG
jgi:hypothetical protein